MKWLATLFALVLATGVHAQEKDPQEQLMEMIATCLPVDILEQRMLDDYREIPFAESNGIIQHITGDFAEGKLKIYVNPETFTVSVVVEFQDEVGCIVYMGSNFTPIPGTSI